MMTISAHLLNAMHLYQLWLFEDLHHFQIRGLFDHVYSNGKLNIQYLLLLTCYVYVETILPVEVI